MVPPWDAKRDTILPWMGHHFAQMGHEMGHHSVQMGHQMGHQWTSKWCPVSLWSSAGPIEGSPPGFWVLSGRKTRSRYQKRTRRRFAIFAGCGILLPTSFQPCKGGDMACARGPLGACVATCHNVGHGERALRVLEALPPFCCRKALKTYH